MPHTVLLGDVTSFIDQNFERQADFLNVAAHRVSPLRDDGNQSYAAASIDVDVSCQFTELAAAIRSPGAAMEREQQGSACQEGFEAPPIASEGLPPRVT